MISNELKTLVSEFNRISKLNWLESVNKGTGSIGLTFERELHKRPNNLFFPDFKGIEIKCTTRFSRFPFSLFSIAFDGPTYPEINRLIDLYGYNDYVYKDKKVLKVNVDTINKKKSGNYRFRLHLDELNNKIYLEVFNLNNELIEMKSFVYLDSVINRLKLKLTNLVIIHGSKKKVNGIEYFRYYKLESYKLRSPDYFISLIKKGIIFVTLECRVGKSKIFAGKYKNKNLVFRIKKEYIEELFENSCIIDNDLGINGVVN